MSKHSKKHTKKNRKLSAFNLFMKKEVPRVKAAHAGMKHTDAFKLAAKNWKNHSNKSHEMPNKKSHKKSHKLYKKSHKLHKK